jgi:hypothetical protein
MKRNILLLTLLMLVAAFSFVPVMAQPCSPVEIWKEPYCWADAGDVMYSDNPPYYVGMKYYWWIKITVHANVDLSSVMVYDRLGAELMIEGISVDTPKYDPYDYDFTYMDYEWNGDVNVNGYSGKLNKDGITFDGFTVYWTGKSVKVHFKWDIGAMSAGTTKTIYVTVSTDTNPAGKQEYTSCGWYYLNSGATVKAIVASTGKQFSAESDSIQIYVNPT